MLLGSRCTGSSRAGGGLVHQHIPLPGARQHGEADAIGGVGGVHGVVHHIQRAGLHTDVKPAGNIDIETAGNTNIDTAGNTDVETAGNIDVVTAGNIDMEPAGNTEDETAGNSD